VAGGFDGVFCDRECHGGKGSWKSILKQANVFCAVRAVLH
jgi:hypothetical protein